MSMVRNHRGSALLSQPRASQPWAESTLRRVNPGECQGTYGKTCGLLLYMGPKQGRSSVSASPGPLARDTGALPMSLQPTSRGPVVAYFDLDGTLLTVNSGALWMRRERRLGRISNRQFARGLIWLLAYRVSVMDMDEVLDKALVTIANLPEEMVRRWTRDWYHAEVARHVAPGARAALAEHRAAGHRLVLLTSSSPYASDAAVEHLGMDEFLCTHYQVRDGRFTGSVERPCCYGIGKVTHAERHAAEAGIDLARCYFYTDSFSDLPMLLRVGHPRVVNPDLRLRLAAFSRGWPVLKF